MSTSWRPRDSQAGPPAVTPGRGCRSTDRSRWLVEVQVQGGGWSSSSGGWMSEEQSPSRLRPAMTLRVKIIAGDAHGRATRARGRHLDPAVGNMRGILISVHSPACAASWSSPPSCSPSGGSPHLQGCVAAKGAACVAPQPGPFGGSKGLHARPLTVLRFRGGTGSLAPPSLCLSPHSSFVVRSGR